MTSISDMPRIGAQNKGILEVLNSPRSKTFWRLPSRLKSAI